MRNAKEGETVGQYGSEKLKNETVEFKMKFASGINQAPVHSWRGFAVGLDGREGFGRGDSRALYPAAREQAIGIILAPRV